MEDFYLVIGQYLVDNIQSEDWTKIILNIEISEKYRGFSAIYETKDGEIIDSDMDFSIEFGKKVKEFFLYTKDNNFTPYNRAVFTLESSGDFNMDFKWDQELQDKWDGKK